MWLDITSGVLGFIGTIIFSIGLLKPKQQIKDEHTSYWGSNPYTFSSDMNSQPYYLAGVIAILIAFSITLGKQVSTLFPNQNLLVTLLIILCLILIGLVGIILIYIKHLNDNTNLKYELFKKSFKRNIEMYLVELNSNVVASETQPTFLTRKQGYTASLQKKIDEASGLNSEKEANLVEDSGRIDDLEGLKYIYETFIK